MDCYESTGNPGFRFYANGTYVGAGPGSKALCYDNHPGLDYPVPNRTPVLATADGTIRYTDSSCGTNGITSCMVGVRSPRELHVLELRPSANTGVRVYYLHLTSDKPVPGAVKTPVDDPTPGCPSPIQLPLDDGVNVKKGCIIAVSGDAGTERPHLHFEVQKRILKTDLQSIPDRFICRDDSSLYCIPVDPHGWNGVDKDPYPVADVNVRLWDHLPALYDASPRTFAPGEVTVDFAGLGIKADATVRVYNASNLQTPLTLLSAPLIVGDKVSITLDWKRGEYFVCVVNPDGKRSNAIPIKVE